MVFSSSVMEANFFTMERRREMAEAEQRALHMLTIQELRQVHAGGRRSGLHAYTRIACMHLMPSTVMSHAPDLIPGHCFHGISIFYSPQCRTICTYMTPHFLA